MHETTSYFVVDAAPCVLEFWFDWVPSVDEGLLSLAPETHKGLIRSSDVIIQKNGAGRLFKNVQEDILKDIPTSKVFAVMCGPSGVLARVPVEFL